MFPWENVVRVPFHGEVPKTPFPCSLSLISARQHGVMERTLCLEHDDMSSSPRFPAVWVEWPLDSRRLSFFICQAGMRTPTSLGFSELKGKERLQNPFENCKAPVQFWKVVSNSPICYDVSPLHKFYMKVGFYFSGLHGQGPRPLWKRACFCLWAAQVTLFQKLQLPYCMSSETELKESNDCNTCGQYVVQIRLPFGALLTGRKGGRGSCDIGRSSRTQGQVASQVRGWDFLSSSLLVQPENLHTTGGFCPLWPP